MKERSFHLLTNYNLFFKNGGIQHTNIYGQHCELWIPLNLLFSKKLSIYTLIKIVLRSILLTHSCRGKIYWLLVC